FEDVVLAPDDVAAGEGFREGEDGGQRLEFDSDGAPGFLEKVAVRMRQQQHRLLRMIDRLVREARLVVKNERNVVGARDIARPHNGEFVPGNAGAEAY